MTYDALNRLTSLVDAVGTTAYTYAPAGQLTTENGPFASDTVTNLYWNRLRLKMNLQQPVGVWTNAFGYDLASRLGAVVTPAGEFDYEYLDALPSLLVKKKRRARKLLAQTAVKSAFTFAAKSVI